MIGEGGGRRKEGGGRRSEEKEGGRKEEEGRAGQEQPADERKKKLSKKMLPSSQSGKQLCEKACQLHPKVNLKNLYKPTPAICDARKDMVPSET